MSKKNNERKQMTMLFPIEGKGPKSRPVSTSVEYRSEKFYAIRDKMISTLPKRKIS